MKEPTIVFHYKNRRGDSYYLHQGITKTGNPKYYFSMKKKDNTLVSIPEGFEIYENPNAQVFFLVKKEPPLITTDERQLELPVTTIRMSLMGQQQKAYKMHF